MAHQCPTCLDVIDAGHECQPCKIKLLEARVAELEAQLQKTRNSWTVQQDLLQDACNAHAHAAHVRNRYREALDQIINDPRWDRFENADAAWIYTIATEALKG